MAKIDISKIEGYAEMSAEEKLAALEAFELPDPDFTGWVKKETADKYASEAAEFKKKLRQQMTEDEAEKAAAAENLANIQAELESLRAEKTVSEYTAQYMGIGYDEALAKATATALQKGEMNTVFRNHAKFVAERDKALKAELLKTTPTPPAGDGNNVKTRDDLKNMSLLEKQKFAKENPEQYKQIYSKGE